MFFHSKKKLSLIFRYSYKKNLIISSNQFSRYKNKRKFQLTAKKNNANKHKRHFKYSFVLDDKKAIV